MKTAKILYKNISTFSILIVIFFCSWLLRWWGLNSYTLSSDELIHLFVANANSLEGVAQNTRLIVAHAPLYYFLLFGFTKLGANDAIFRYIMILFGMLYIWLSYYMGKRLLGTSGGLFLAFLGAFGMAPVVLSQVLREYVVLLSLEILLILAFLSLVKKFSREAALVYFPLSAMSLLLSYPSVFVLSGFGVVMLVDALVNKVEKKQVLILVFGNLALGGIFLFLYLFSILGWYELRSPYITHSFESWISSGWLLRDSPVTIAAVAIRNFFSMFVYFSYPSIPIVSGLIILFIFGVAVMIRKSAFAILGVLFISVSLNISASLWGKYPFIASRHSVFLMPLILLVAAYGFCSLYDSFRKKGISILRGNYYRCIALLVIFVSVAFTVFFAKNDVYRRLQPYEFLLKKSEINRASAFLFSNIKPGESVILEPYSLWYLFRDLATREITMVNENLATFRRDGVNYFYNLDGYPSSEEALIAQIFKKVVETQPKGDNVYFFAGGRMAFEEISTNKLFNKIFTLQDIYDNDCLEKRVKIIPAIYREGKLEDIIVKDFVRDDACRGIMVFSVPLAWLGARESATD